MNRAIGVIKFPKLTSVSLFLNNIWDSEIDYGKAKTHVTFIHLI